MRVLHLLDSASDWPAVHGVWTLATFEPEQHAVVVFGAPRLAALAASFGLVVDRVAAPASPRVLARLMDSRPRPNVIHAWSISAARRGLGVRPRADVVLSLWQRPVLGSLVVRRSMRRTLGGCRSVVFTGQSLRNEYAEVAALGPDAMIVEAPVSPRLFSSSNREAIRRDWSVSADTTVIAIIADPQPSADARHIGYQAGVLSIAGRRSAAIVPPNARDIERAMRFRRHHRDREWEIVVEDRPIWDWLPACDACVWCDDGALRTGMLSKRDPPSPIGVAWAAAAGVPIIAEDGEAVRALLGPEGATYVSPGSRLELNRGLLRVIDDSAWRAGRVSAAREFASRFTAERFRQAMNGVYEGRLVSA